MATENQIKNLEKKLRDYRKKYLTKKTNLELDESGTRLMVNNFLTEVLGYIELEDIKTEYNIRGEYADYVIQLKRKKHFVIEVKSIQLDLNANHLRQSVSYAANEGIDWIVLFNGKQIQLYRLIFAKPISTQLVFEFDLTDLSSCKVASQHIIFLTKTSVSKNELPAYWKHFDALTPASLIKHVYSLDVVNAMRRKLRQTTGINFNQQDIVDGLHNLIKESNESVKPRNLK
jgi:hypothetical protein